MSLFGRMSLEERVREAYDTFTEEAQPYLFPEGEKDAQTIIEALSDACGLRERNRSPKKCEDLLDLWAEMFRCTELGKNRDERIRLLRKKYGALVKNETMADRVCNWCEKKLNARFGETLTDSGMLLTRFPEEKTQQADETEPPETEASEPGNMALETQKPAVPDPKKVAGILKDARGLKGPVRKQMLESLKPRRNEWINAALVGQQAGGRGTVGSIFLAGLVAAGGHSAEKTEIRDLLKAFLTDTKAEELWPTADDEWKREALKAAWQLGARLGYEEQGTGYREQGEEWETDDVTEAMETTEVEETIEEEMAEVVDEAEVEEATEETTEVVEAAEVEEATEETTEAEEVVSEETDDEEIWGNDL